MAEICLNANAACPYGACAMPVRHFAATSHCEAHTYGCRASPLVTLLHTAVIQIRSCEKMSALRVDLFALAKCRAGASTCPSVRTQMLESFETPSNAGAPSRCSLPPPGPLQCSSFVWEILPTPPQPTLQMCSQKLAGKGEGKKGCLRYPRELCFLW